ncbi:hypothetical protein EV421DRAFT_1503898 [Armillaria borealis]|uniref:Secreted protein n=1 Tax=Armillaria borealis TaxID=47425 RepID=A0AA39IZ02_9AGAR|nr:hypothetical protein EV421DRAFT_1503898 [Armillaria borealis]
MSLGLLLCSIASFLCHAHAVLSSADNRRRVPTTLLCLLRLSANSQQARPSSSLSNLKAGRHIYRARSLHEPLTSRISTLVLKTFRRLFPVGATSHGSAFNRYVLLSIKTSPRAAMRIVPLAPGLWTFAAMLWFSASFGAYSGSILDPSHQGRLFFVLFSIASFRT